MHTDYNRAYSPRIDPHRDSHHAKVGTFAPVAIAKVKKDVGATHANHGDAVVLMWAIASPTGARRGAGHGCDF